MNVLKKSLKIFCAVYICVVFANYHSYAAASGRDSYIKYYSKEQDSFLYHDERGRFDLRYTKNLDSILFVMTSTSAGAIVFFTADGSMNTSAYTEVGRQIGGSEEVGEVVEGINLNLNDTFEFVLPIDSNGRVMADVSFCFVPPTIQEIYSKMPQFFSGSTSHIKNFPLGDAMYLQSYKGVIWTRIRFQTDFKSDFSMDSSIVLVLNDTVGAQEELAPEENQPSVKWVTFDSAEINFVRNRLKYCDSGNRYCITVIKDTGKLAKLRVQLKNTSRQAIGFISSSRNSSKSAGCNLSFGDFFIDPTNCYDVAYLVEMRILEFGDIADFVIDASKCSTCNFSLFLCTAADFRVSIWKNKNGSVKSHLKHGRKYCDAVYSEAIELIPGLFNFISLKGLPGKSYTKNAVKVNVGGFR